MGGDGISVEEFLLKTCRGVGEGVVSTSFTESTVEEAALCWLADLGYEILHGPEIAPGEPFAGATGLRRPAPAGPAP